MDKKEIVRLTIDIPRDMHRQFKSSCAVNDLSMGWVTNELIRSFVESQIGVQDVEVGKS